MGRRYASLEKAADLRVRRARAALASLDEASRIMAETKRLRFAAQLSEAQQAARKAQQAARAAGARDGFLMTSGSSSSAGTRLSGGGGGFRPSVRVSQAPGGDPQGLTWGAPGQRPLVRPVPAGLAGSGARGLLAPGDGGKREERHRGSVKVSGHGVGGDSFGAQKALYGADKEGHVERQRASVKVSGNGMGGDSAGAENALHGADDGEYVERQKASIKVSGNGIGGDSFGAQKALYGADDGEYVERQKASIKVSGNGMGGDSSGAEKALYGAEDGEYVERQQASIKVSGNGMGGDSSGVERALHAAEDGEHVERQQASIKVTGNGMGGDSTGAAKALYGAEDGEVVARQKASIRVAGDGMGGAESGAFEGKRPLASVKMVAGKGLGGGGGDASHALYGRSSALDDGGVMDRDWEVNDSDGDGDGGADGAGAGAGEGRTPRMKSTWRADFPPPVSVVAPVLGGGSAGWFGNGRGSSAQPLAEALSSMITSSSSSSQPLWSLLVPPSAGPRAFNESGDSGDGPGQGQGGSCGHLEAGFEEAVARAKAHLTLEAAVNDLLTGADPSSRAPPTLPRDGSGGDGGSSGGPGSDESAAGGGGSGAVEVPLQVLVERCVLGPIATQAAAADRVAVSCLVHGHGLARYRAACRCPCGAECNSGARGGEG